MSTLGSDALDKLYPLIANTYFDDPSDDDMLEDAYEGEEEELLNRSLVTNAQDH
jgi:hypothetical protein